ncbi:hypothetical protein IAT38_000913 [Cryptococcus sp. DSM 104549]
MPPQPDENALQALLAALSKNPSLSIDDITLLASALLPSSPRSTHALAYLCLSKFFEGASASSDVIKRATDTFLPYLRSVLAPSIKEIEKDEEATEVDAEPCVPPACLLAAVYPLAPEVATALLTEKLGEVDTLAILLEVGELPSPLQPAFAELLVQAAGTPSGRDLVQSRAVEWLRGGVDYEATGELGVLCAVALSKLGRAPPQPKEGERAVELDVEDDDEALCKKMMAHIQSTTTFSPTVLSTIEGLSVLSLRPHNKALLASSPAFLKALVALAPVPGRRGGSLPVTPRASMDLEPKLEAVETSLCYGLTIVLVNLTSQKIVLSEQEQNMVKLRAMAASANRGGGAAPPAKEDEDPELMTDEEVQKRVKAVLAAGVTTALSGLVRGESRLVREALGRLCVNLVEERADRLGFVRDGGYKVLSVVIRDLLTMAKPSAPAGKREGEKKGEKKGEKSDEPPIDILPPLQALAKLVITTPPTLLFPPPHLTTSLNALTPLYHLLTHPSSRLIQRFEALMALTNLASIDPSLAQKIVQDSITPFSDGGSGMFTSTSSSTSARIVVRVEELVLDDNTLVRRAAVQLVCNLCSSIAGFDYFSGESSERDSARARSRLQILLVMTCSDDLPTRLAAGGALAVLTESQIACQVLLKGDPATMSSTPRSVWHRVLGMLAAVEHIDESTGESIEIISSAGPEKPNRDMVYRGVIVILNLVSYVYALEGEEKAKAVKQLVEEGVEEKMVGVLGMRVGLEIGQEVLPPTMECLKIIRREK